MELDEEIIVTLDLLLLHLVVDSLHLNIQPEDSACSVLFSHLYIKKSTYFDSGGASFLCSDAPML